MRQIKIITLLAFISAVTYSCNSSSELEKKQKELAEYKTQMAELKAKVSQLETEINELDTTEEKSGVLVALYDLKKEAFSHKFETRGSIESRKNVLISAETMGRIVSIPVSEGQKVTKGQLLVQLDAAILQNNVNELKTKLELAATLYERQQKLWDQNIGTEVQYLQAKNNKESLESSLKTLQSQLAQSYVRAPFDGVVDDIPVKVGEMAQPGISLVRIVNQKDMYIKADVSEAYLGKLTVGETVSVRIASLDTTVSSKITSVGRVINEQNRTFGIEASLSSGLKLQPNQVVVLTVTDYLNEKALSVPSKIIQVDPEGEFIYTVVQKGGTSVATKTRIKTGKTFDGETEVISGLKGSEKVIVKGYRDVNEGAEVIVG